MTDNEIKKALDEAELFLRNRVMDGQALKLNAYDIGILRNISQVCAKAYDEINRLQAKLDEAEDIIQFADRELKKAEVEIERLTTERDNEHRCYLHICEDLKQAVNRNITAKAENERLSKITRPLIAEIKAEAYERCIENAKEELYEWVGADSSISYSRIKKVLDKLLKELVGE